MGERAASSPPALARVSESPVVPAYEYDLGRYSRPVSTSSPDAQAWFDRGLAWSYGFNHEEAVRCFQRAVEADPSCAMAHWGIAYAMGPNYNKDWVAFEPDELIEMVAARACGRRTGALAAGRRDPGRAGADRGAAGALPGGHAARGVLALERRLRRGDAQPPTAEFGDDPDVATLCAEALIGRTPWQLWNVQTGEPAEGADTREALAVLERGMASSPEPHPGLLHIYLHTMEMSPFPGARAAGGRPAARARARRRAPAAHAHAHRRAVRPLPRRHHVERAGDRGRSQVPRARGRAQLLHALPLPRLPLQDLRRDLPRPDRSRRSRRPPRWPRRSARSC